MGTVRSAAAMCKATGSCSVVLCGDQPQT